MLPVPFCHLTFVVAKPSERSQRLALGRRLKPHRKALRLRQADAARILGVSEFTYRNWEQGLYPPPARYAARLLAFLDQSVTASKAAAKEPAARG